MAANSLGTSANRISGKIVLKETGVGIPDLLVVIYDLDPGARTEEEFATPAGPMSVATTTPVPPLLGDRLGSVLLGPDGSWSLVYQYAEFRILNNTEKRPDLHLMVLAPEDADSDKPPTVLFNSKLMRMNSGRLKACLIRITVAQLKAVNVPVPAAAEEGTATDAKIQKYRESKSAQRVYRTDLKTVNRETEEQDAEARKEFRETIGVIRPDLEALSKWPTAQPQQVPAEVHNAN